MKAQQLVQCMVPRALFGGVRNTKSVYSSDSPLLLSRPSVSGADLKNKYTSISSTVSSKQLFLYRYQPDYFQYVAADDFYFFGHSCTVFSIKQVFVFFLPSNHVVRQNLRRTERKYRWTDSIKSQNNY